MKRLRDKHDPYDGESLARMHRDPQVLSAVRMFMGKTFEYGYYRNFTWLGRPIIQYPQDIVALQQLIWEYQPTLVIETGVALGGSLILYASILELIGGQGIALGIEVEFREHNKAAVAAHPLAKRIEVIEGSSVSSSTVSLVRAKAKEHERIMLVLDSLHTHEHVLAELRLYTPLLKAGAPLVVFGTSVGEISPEIDLEREWNQQRNPASALKEFMAENDRFEVDYELNDALFITDAPNGYLRCTRDR